MVPNENGQLSEIKISQFADDTTLILGNVNDTEKALQSVMKFGDIAGLKLNISKTEGLLLGRDKGKEEKNLPNIIKWSAGPVRLLGVYVGGTKDTCDTQNWESKIQGLENVLNTWKTRDLTLFGKITILKTLALPKLIYLAGIIEVPPYVIKKVEKLLYKFVWKSKDRIKRKVLIKPIEEGGLGMIDIVSQFNALKAAWMTRILQNKDTNWSKLARFYLGKIGLELVTKFTIVKENIPFVKKFPEFYQEVISAYSRAKQPNHIESKSDLFNSILWGNHLFKVRDKDGTEKVLFFKSWIDSGVVRLSDCIFDDKGLDIKATMNKIATKTNILCESSLIMKALKPYRKLFQNPECNPMTDTTHKATKILSTRSRDFYTILVEKRSIKHALIQKWKAKLTNR